MRYIIFILLFSNSLFAIEISQEEKTDTTQVEEVTHHFFDSKHWRTTQKWGAVASFSPFDLWLPSKIGASIYYHPNQKINWELELLRGSLPINLLGIDIGSFSDTRISLLRRSFNNRNSFNFLYGLFYNSVKISLGDDLLATVTGASRASVDLIEVQNIGITLGIGNRWQLKNRFVFGVDWLQMNLPLASLGVEAPFIDETSDGGAKDDVEELLSLLKRVPTFVLFKLQLGIGF